MIAIIYTAQDVNAFLPYFCKVKHNGNIKTITTSDPMVLGDVKEFIDRFNAHKCLVLDLKLSLVYS